MLCHTTAEGRVLFKLAALSRSHYSGKGTEKGELQGQFSISIDHQLRGEPTGARQVTSSQALLHPRGCSRNRQLKSFNLGRFPGCHPYHSSRHAGVNTGKGHPGWQPPVSAHPGGKSSSSHTASARLPSSAGTPLRGTGRASFL